MVMAEKDPFGMLARVEALSDSGRSAAVVAELGAVPSQEIRQSPALALLLGIALGRLGNHDSSRELAVAAWEVARSRGDRAVEARSLNVCGAIAFQEGRIGEAAQYFGEGLLEAERQGDLMTMGRCSNNLGITANLRGQYGHAVGFHTAAVTAFQRAGHRRGLAEAFHNLAINYRDQRAFARALMSEDRAEAEATGAGDLALLGLVYCARGEIRLRMGELELGRRDIQRALDLHRDVGDTGAEAEDLRAMAEVLDHLRQPVPAEDMLRGVLERAWGICQPLLAAQAQRDLARLLHRQKRYSEAKEAALAARKRFVALGAVSEIGRLDDLLRRSTIRG
jgi:tetratricopeptide (TPR) repeat protein